MDRAKSTIILHSPQKNAILAFMKTKNTILLLTAAFIWGTAFVAQSKGADANIGPFTFNCLRNILGFLVLLPCISFLDNFKRKTNPENFDESKTHLSKTLLLGGLACGTFLCAASYFQQYGIQYTTVGKAGFITALYIVIVPVAGIFFHKKIGAKVWVGVVLAFIGLYLLSVTESFTIAKGDYMCMICALIFSAHIITVDKISPHIDGVRLSCIQFLVCAIISGIGMFLTETPSLEAIKVAAPSILYVGIFSSGIAYTFQIVGQTDSNPAIASLIMSLESVFSLLAGWVILHERLSAKELAGCLLMAVAIVLATLPDKKSEKETTKG